MIRRVVFLLLSLTLAAPLAHAQRELVNTNIVIGGLFSLTGDGATLGKASEAALYLAARDINAEFETLRLPFRVEVVFGDTQLKPDVAVTKIAQLYDYGVRTIIGPQTSAEAGAIRAYANAQGILLISQASTASSLAIAGDNLFRLAPNDRVEGAAVAALLRADGIDVMVPIYRADAGNTGLRDGVAQFFTAAGGIAQPGVSYAPATTDFAATVTALGAAVRAAKNERPAARVAVYIASFEEGGAIADLARLDPDLAGARWYSGDGLTQSQVMLSTPAIAAFAAATKFTAPAVSLGETTRDRWLPLSEEIRTMVGFLPDAFSLSVYDAAWVAALSAVQVRNQAAVRRESFVRNVQRYWGVTGPLALDFAGDRKNADFDFWTVTNGAWVRTARWVSGALVP